MNLENALSLAVRLVFPAEGCPLRSYLDKVADPPVWTIGYGTTFIDDRPVTQGMVCTQAQADQWATAALRTAATQITRMVKVALTDTQLAALISFVYNLGIGTFQRSDVLAALQAGQYHVAADRMLEYDHAGSVKVPGLTTRRARERALFLSAMPLTVTPDPHVAAPPAQAAAPEALSEADVRNEQELRRLHGEGEDNQHDIDP